MPPVVSCERVPVVDTLLLTGSKVIRMGAPADTTWLKKSRMVTVKVGISVPLTTSSRSIDTSTIWGTARNSDLQSPSVLQCRNTQCEAKRTQFEGHTSHNRGCPQEVPEPHKSSHNPRAQTKMHPDMRRETHVDAQEP